MARRKRSASHYEKAVTRLAALKSIDEKMDLGNGITVAVYEDTLKVLRNCLDEYNTMLSTIDDKLNNLEDVELKLRNLSERLLAGIASKYGKDSSEYEMAGGRRRRVSRRKVLTEAKEV